MPRFATWNVNSLKVRQDRVVQWLSDISPDIVCLQETKLADSAFPQLTFEALGYSAVHHGEGRWNGVAMLSRNGLDNVSFGFADGLEPDSEARIMTATCDGITVVNVYVPNGRVVGSDHFAYKLSWLERLGAHVDAVTTPGDAVIVAGDFNVAPTDTDVYDPVAFEGETHVTEPERAAVAALIDRGLSDVFRLQHPAAEKVFSWWDYRRGDFHEGRGMRIDLVLASASIAARVEWCIIDRNARKGQLPSDHAPIVVDLAG
jgi:exodeoxyribonuclease III